MARNNSEAQKRADQKYNAKVKKMLLEFYPTDKDIIEHLDNLDQPKQTYIKALIRKDMKIAKLYAMRTKMESLADDKEAEVATKAVEEYLKSKEQN